MNGNELLCGNDWSKYDPPAGALSQGSSQEGNGPHYITVQSEFGVYWAVGGRLFHLTGQEKAAVRQPLRIQEKRTVHGKTRQDAGNVTRHNILTR